MRFQAGVDGSMKQAKMVMVTVVMISFHLQRLCSPVVCAFALLLSSDVSYDVVYIHTSIVMRRRKMNMNRCKYDMNRQIGIIALRIL